VKCDLVNDFNLKDNVWKKWQTWNVK
jgi:hypothetical protein